MRQKKMAAARRAKEGGKLADPNLARRRETKTLDNGLKLRIIELFAQFYTAASIREQIDIEYGKWLDIKVIASYNPSKPSSPVGKKLRAVFDKMRAEYVSRSTNLAMAHQAHRLRMIGEIVEKATTAKDFGNAIKGLELAAKEMGGVLEGKQTIVHQGAIAHVHGTLEDARSEVAMRLQQIVEGGLLLPEPTPDAAPDTQAQVSDTQG